MSSFNVTFVTAPKFEGQEFSEHQNERAMLKNAVSDLRFLASLLLCVSEATSLEVLFEAKASGKSLSVEANLVAAWVKLLFDARPQEAKELFYDCNKFNYLIHETIRNNV